MEIAKPILQLSALLYFISMAGYLCYLFHQKDKIQRLSLMLVGAAVVSHLIAVVITGTQARALPINNMVQSLSMAGLAFGVTFLYVQYRFNLKILGLFATTVLSAIMLAVVVLPDTPVAPDKILKGFWFVSHIVLSLQGKRPWGLPPVPVSSI